MIKISDTNRFENIISNIEVSSIKISEIFDRTDTNMERINGTDTWNGITQEECYNKYKELSSNYGSINDSLKIYTNFMRQIVDNYKNVENQLNNNINESTTQLDINS